MPPIKRPKDHSTPHAKRSRAARGWARQSAKALGEDLGRNKEYVDRRENGQYDYKASELIAIADIAGVPKEFMLEGWDGVRREAEIALIERVQLAAAEEHEAGRTIDPASVAATMKLLRLALGRREGP